MKVAAVSLSVNTVLASQEPETVRVLTLRLEEGEKHMVVTFNNGLYNKCEYGGTDRSSPSTYSYKDWEFLGKASKAIQDLQCEFEVNRTGITGAMDCSNLVGEIRDINPDAFRVH